MKKIVKDFRKELLRTDVVPRKLNEVSLKYKEMFLEDLKSGKIKTEEVVKCQCGGSNLEQLARIDRFGLPFGSLICQDCGLVITSPRIVEESLPYYYDTYYHPLNYGREDLENQTALFADGQGKKIFSILKEYLPQKKKLKILEVGAGTGNVLAEFKSEAKQHDIEIDELGTEYSNDCILKARKDNNINIIFGNAETIVKRNEKFDVIILSHVFEHFIDLNKELNNLKKLMTNDSLLYIEVPGIMVNHKKHYYDFSFLYYLTHAHIYNFTKTTLSNILYLNGMKSIFSNEEVFSVSILNTNNIKYKIKNDYFSTLKYLECLVNDQDYFKQLYFYKKQYFSQQKTIKNRENTIKGKEFLISKMQKELQKQEIFINKQQNTIKNRENTIKGKDYLLDILSGSIEEINSYSLITNPLKKYKAYKNMLMNFYKIKRKLKNESKN